MFTQYVRFGQKIQRYECFEHQEKVFFGDGSMDISSPPKGNSLKPPTGQGFMSITSAAAKASAGNAR
jgi:hypothetical protein